MELKGCSYARRVAEVNAIYDEYAKTGLSNREIWRRYIYPIYSISEKLLQLHQRSDKARRYRKRAGIAAYFVRIATSGGTGCLTSFFTAESSYKRV